jgi:amino-acid N-acetyltransferase
MNITPASQNNLSAAINLLKSNNLPTEDISDVTKLFVLEEGNEVKGAVGIEASGLNALLRSLVVTSDKRNAGYGKSLVNFIERFAQENGVKELFLLTTTADKFFASREYKIISREEVPEFIRQSSEFSSVCPSSAIIMKKDLGQIALTR